MLLLLFAWIFNCCIIKVYNNASSDNPIKLLFFIFKL